MGLMPYFINTPILHHCSTLKQRLSRTFGNLKFSYLLVITALIKKLRFDTKLHFLYHLVYL